MKIITEAELQRVLVCSECGDAKSLARLQAILRTIQQREGPKFVCTVGQVFDMQTSDEAMEKAGRAARLYSLPEIPQ